MSRVNVLTVLDRRIQAWQSQPKFGSELDDLIEVRAVTVELMAVVHDFLDLPLLPETLEERAISVLARAGGFADDD